MMNFIFFVSVFFLSSWVGACEVHLPRHLLILGPSAQIATASAHTGCSENELLMVNEVISAVEGKITSFQIAEIFKTKGLIISVQPQMIQVQHLGQLVREQLHLPTGVQLKSSEAVDANNLLSLAPGDRVEIECTACLFGSRQPLNLNVKGFDGSMKSFTILADFKKLVKSYRMLTSQAAFSEITPNMLREEYVESIPHTELVTNLNTLKFYKLNKPLRAGELLKQSDLNALNLVRAGVMTEVVIENDLVKVKTTGISRSNGVLGQMVEVYHPKKNKKYYGKVIDNNKVLVDL